MDLDLSLIQCIYCLDLWLPLPKEIRADGHITVIWPNIFHKSSVGFVDPKSAGAQFGSAGLNVRENLCYLSFFLFLIYLDSM